MHGVGHVQVREFNRANEIAWHGVKLNQPDWSASSHTVALTAEIRNEGLLFHLILNAYWEPLDFELPVVEKRESNPWRRWIDTALDSPHDIVEWQSSASIGGHIYRAEPRSLVMLFARIQRWESHNNKE